MVIIALFVGDRSGIVASTSGQPVKHPLQVKVIFVHFATAAAQGAGLINQDQKHTIPVPAQHAPSITAQVAITTWYSDLINLSRPFVDESSILSMP